MGVLWYVLVAAALVVYVVLDGFDLGVGALYLLFARNDAERAALRASIGPVWDANEVWLIAGGGTLYFAFPALYAVGFSGFYLPLMLVLWLLILRALGLELRHHLDDPLVGRACDVVFAWSSALLALVFGVAIGNVVRGVPLEEDGYFFVAFWTDGRAGGPRPGVLDWYTLLTGLLGLTALAVHGAAWLSLRMEEPLAARARAWATRGSGLLVVLTLVGAPTSLLVRPNLTSHFASAAWGGILPLGVAASLVALFVNLRARRDRAAFLSSAAYLVTMLGTAAFAVYPVLLHATTDASRSLTVAEALAPALSLRIGLVWWTIALLAALGYFVHLYRAFSGRIAVAPPKSGDKSADKRSEESLIAAAIVPTPAATAKDHSG